METEQVIQCMQNGKTWIDYLSALLTPTIAIFGSIIAFQQWRTNRARLKNELFDRRYQQYSVVRNFLASIMSSGKCKVEEQRKYLAGTRGMRFIFDKEVASYVDDTIWELALDLEVLDADLGGLPVGGEERSQNVRKQREIKKLLYRELRTLDDKFSKYLQLQH